MFYSFQSYFSYSLCVQYVPALPVDALRTEDEHDGGLDTGLDTVHRQEDLMRSLADQHKLELMKRRNLKRNKPSLPILVENRVLEEAVKNFQRKLRKVDDRLFSPYNPIRLYKFRDFRMAKRMRGKF